jgi:hypothetical protein
VNDLLLGSLVGSRLFSDTCTFSARKLVARCLWFFRGTFASRDVFLFPLHRGLVVSLTLSNLIHRSSFLALFLELFKRSFEGVSFTNSNSRLWVLTFLSSKKTTRQWRLPRDHLAINQVDRTIQQLSYPSQNFSVYSSRARISHNIQKFL